MDFGYILERPKIIISYLDATYFRRVFVMGWTYLNYYEPLFLPLGLGVLIVYTIQI